jgi:Tol biopolymer transport system component
MSYRTLRKQFVAVSCLVALAAWARHESPAAKPGGGGGGGPVPPGTIYFHETGDGLWSMNGDGSGKTPVPVSGTPSYQTHAGSRWFLQFAYVDFVLRYYDADGYPVYWYLYDIVAVNEAGQGVTLATVTDSDVPGPIWSHDDAHIAFVSAEQPGYVPAEYAPYVGPGGLYVMDIDWSSGAPSPGAWALGVESPYLNDPLLNPDTLTTWGYVGLYPEDWSPAGDELVYVGAFGADQYMNESYGRYVATFTASGTATRLLLAPDDLSSWFPGATAVWSPDGSRIAFVKRLYVSGWDLGEVWTVKPDGTNAAALTHASVSKTTHVSQRSPTWSPDGAFVAYSEAVVKNSGSQSGTYNVLRIPAGGGARVALTSDGTSGSPRWRP